MNRQDPSLLSLRAFEVAANRMSFTEAARQLHVSQAAISRHIRLLERQLGQLLFHRLHRRVELTAAGTRLANELAAGFSQIWRAVENARKEPARRLRISVEPGFAARWLVPRLGRFTTHHPDIEVDLESSGELRSVGRDTDIALRFVSLAARKPKQGARKLFAYNGFPVIASAKRTVRVGRNVDRDVLGFRLLHDDDGASWRQWFAAAGLEGFDTAKHVYFNDYALVHTATLRGQGVALSAAFYVGAHLRSGRLTRIGRTAARVGDYWLIEAKDSSTAKARAAFIAWLYREAKALLRVKREDDPLQN